MGSYYQDHFEEEKRDDYKDKDKGKNCWCECKCKGEKGERGEKGDCGSKGEKGERGEKGEKGEGFNRETIEFIHCLEEAMEKFNHCMCDKRR